MAGSAAGTSSVVLDTTVVAAFAFREPRRPEAVVVCDKVVRNELAGFVPDLMWAELQNVCARKRDQDGLAGADIEAAYASAGSLPLVVQNGSLQRYRSEAWDLIRLVTNVGSYDMYFLALAIDLGIPLWTFDQAFRDAVNREGTYAGSVCLIGVDVTI